MIIVAIKQFRVGVDNFSYVIYCPKISVAAIVDPSYDAIKTIRFISDNKLELKYIINTHYHDDHTYATSKIKHNFPNSQIVASESDGGKLNSKVDIIVPDGYQLKLGEINLLFILTPGHTRGSICVVVNNEALLTGDTLFIGDCGRTDLPRGDLVQMYKTLKEKIIPLPDHLVIYPGHDYGDKPYDILGNQKRTNKVLLAKDLEEFSKIP